MSDADQQHDPRPSGSLLEGLEDARPPGRAARPGLRDRLNRWGETVLYAPWTTRRRRIISGAILAVLLIAGGIGAWLQLRPTPRPDYAGDPLDEVFDYTLLTDEFNELSVEQRLRLLGQLYERMQGMSASESVLLAAFAAQIEGELREQMEENISRLMIDTADMLALKYQQLPSDASKAERIAALEDAYVEFIKLGGVFDGEPVDEPPEEILAEGREEARQREAEMAEEGASLREADWAFNMVQESARQYATPQQRVRVTRFMRDMVRHMRGEDIATGEKTGPGGG